MPDSSIGATTGSPSDLPSWKSSAPQPGAMWTIPVPSSSPTSSQATTRWRYGVDGSSRVPAAKAARTAGSSSNGPAYSQPTRSVPATSSSTSNGPWSAVLSVPFASQKRSSPWRTRT